MKKTLFTIVALMTAMISYADGIKVVEWNFDSGYNIEGNVLTPNGGEWAATGNKYVSAGLPTIYPDYCYGTLTDYVATCQITNANGDTDNNRAWALVKPAGNNTETKTFRVDIGKGKTENASGVATEDLTDGSKHYIYFQYSFPTTGFENIKMEYSLAYGTSEVKTFTTMLSVDGGTTWTLVGTTDTENGWKKYKTQAYDLTAAADKDNIIVRLFPDGTACSNWNMDYFTVTGDRKVTITDAGYATYYGDCAMTVPSGLTAYWGKLSDDKSKLQLTAISDGIIPANTAVVLSGEAGSYTLTAASEAGGTYNDNALRGITASQAVSTLGLGSGTIYVLAKANSTGKAAFCKFTGTTLGDHRAYLFVADATAPAISIDFGETTGIDMVNGERFMVNGERFTVNGYYNLAGQRIDNKHKGIVIVNGKKVIK